DCDLGAGGRGRIDNPCKGKTSQKHEHRGAGSPVFGAAVCDGGNSAYGVVVGRPLEPQNAPSSTAPTKRNTAHTARTSSLKARSTSGLLAVDGAQFSRRAPWSEAPNVLHCRRFRP